jgi:hypothetical protein
LDIGLSFGNISSAIPTIRESDRSNMTTAEASLTEQTVNDAVIPPVPKQITNAQTVCNEKNEKGKLCNGHLKQLRTAGEAAEIHLRGDDVLFKCQTCATYYMGPPLGHVRDPYKQSRFVEAELSALLQAAGGTLPVIKKDARGVFVMETSHAPSEKPTAKATAPATTQTAAAPAARAAAPSTPKPAASKAGTNPDRTLNKRYTYAGVTDTGPVPGETFEQKVARLKAVSAGAKQRADEGGGPVAPAASPDGSTVPEVAMLDQTASAQATVPAEQSAPASSTLPTGDADRSLMIRSTYCGVVDTGPVPGETFAQKVARLTALSAAVKQRSEGG